MDGTLVVKGDSQEFEFFGDRLLIELAEVLVNLSDHLLTPFRVRSRKCLTTLSTVKPYWSAIV